MALEVGVDDAEQLLSVARGELFDLGEAAPEALIAATWSAGGGRLGAHELVDGGAEGVGERGKDVTGRQRGSALVVSDHALRESDQGAEGTL